MTVAQEIHRQRVFASISAAISAVVVIVLGYFLTSGAYSLVDRVRSVEINQASIKQDVNWIRENMSNLYTKSDAAIDDINDENQWEAINELDRRVDAIEMERSAEKLGAMQMKEG